MAALAAWTQGQLVTMFCQAAVQSGLTQQEDMDYGVNLVMDILQVDAPEPAASMLPLLKLSALLIDCAVQKGLCDNGLEARERLGARLFGAVTPSPRAVRMQFNALQEAAGAEAATHWFYKLCRDNDYIRTEQIAQNIRYSADTPAGELEITINLSKPEKDPRDIAAARRQKAVGYPKCMLCRENPGYAGRPGYPARQNHRIIPLNLGGEAWYFQYSPYLYYEEHCIILNGQHLPMQMTRQSFQKMADFVDLFPHYFVGSNADLPIVGGSILTHDHFQGGRHSFPMDRAAPWFELDTRDSAIIGAALRWPMTCLRFESRDRERLIELMLKVLEAWRGYSDPALQILCATGEPHNALTPVMRKQGGGYRVYLLLRNNRTTSEHPLGLFHPHAPWHHIKKENIGLIEAMGLFILPGRLKEELRQVEAALVSGTPLPEESPHGPWLEELRVQAGDRLAGAQAEAFVREAVGEVCFEVLRDTGVFKQDEAGKAGLLRFLQTLGIRALT
ncbi:MAG: galactose-1-phosphate uridylyltransferase [Christensenellales bacterium]